MSNISVIAIIGRLCGVALFVALLAPMPTSAEANSPNDCGIWAMALHKEGRVRDSRHLHALGCDDQFTPRRYGPDDGECALIARAITQQTGLIRRPRTIAKKVQAYNPACIFFEDWTYGSA